MDQASTATNSVKERRVIWTPQPGPQSDAVCADWCPILLYGGAKFGGKSDFLLGDYLQGVDEYKEHWQGILFRRSLTEFTELKSRARELYPKYGATWHEQAHEWRFPNGAILRFKYLERFSDISMYEGHSYSWIGIDELGDWDDENAFFRIITLNRYARAPVPKKRVRASCNPGGRGHAWIKRYFIDPAPSGYTPLFDDVLKCFRIFIPAKLEDNQIGLTNDPDYEFRLMRAGSPALVQALRYGDWNIVAGAYFHRFSALNVLAPFTIPQWWTRFEGFDPGYSDPFAHGWWCVSGEDAPLIPMPDGSYEQMPRGSLICYREWYGEKETIDGEATRGIKLSIRNHAAGMREREMPGEQIIYRVAGHDLWRTTKGPSDAEEFAAEGFHYSKAEIERKPGWRRMANRIEGSDGVPNVYWFNTCIKCIEHIPLAQHDKKDPEDIEESPNDHTLDMDRYAIMSRPYGNDRPPKEIPIEERFREPTLEQLWQQRERKNARRR